MIPVLYNHDATYFFDTNSLGNLVDAISCKITEELNGSYEMELVYPVDGLHYYDIYERCIVTATPSPYRGVQPFRVYQIEQPMNGVVTIRARHLSYDLSGIPVEMFTTTTNVSDALNGLRTYAAATCPFYVSTNMTTTGTFALTKPASFRAALGGQDGSILDIFGGELLFDNYDVSLLSSRGSVKDYTVEYGKNIIDFNRVENMETMLTGIYPFWQKSGDTQTLTRKIVAISDDTSWVNAPVVDLTDKSDSKPTKNELLAIAEKYIADNGLGYPRTSLDVSFVDLASIPEYASLANKLEIDLGDTITVVFPMYGVQAAEKIVKIETNVLLDRYESITVGHQLTNIADTIAGIEIQVKGAGRV